MTKWNILILTIFILIPIVSGLEMCQDTKEINTNCTMLTPVVTNCTTYNYSIMLINGTIVEESDLTLIGLDIYSLNVTQGEGDYIVRLCDDSTREIKVTDTTGDKTMIAVLILVPLILGLFLLIGSATMGEEHGILRIFMFLLTFILFFTSLHFGMLGVVKFYNFPELQEAIGSTTYWVGIVFGVIVAYFCIYAIIKMIETIAKRKRQKLEY
jgi:uncharacterized membrane protein (DUF441 family)